MRNDCRPSKAAERKMESCRSEAAVFFGARLRALRTRRHWTQAEAAARMGISRITYTRWESGKRYIDIAKIPLLIRVFRCRYEDFFPEVPEVRMPCKWLRGHEWVRMVTQAQREV